MSQNEDEGKVYMDTMPNEDGTKTIVQLGNRANNVDLLKKTLNRIGCSDKINDIDSKDCYVEITTIDSLEPKSVGTKLKELINAISQK